MSEAARLNLDTSVMVNYVYSQLPSDEGDADNRDRLQERGIPALKREAFSSILRKYP